MKLLVKNELNNFDTQRSYENLYVLKIIYK